jgi:hypothetical protein
MLLSIAMTAALSLKIDLVGLIQKRYHPAPQVKSLTCHIDTVSYRFVGNPGMEFRYDGDSYRVPQSGSIELVSTRAQNYEVAGRTLPLNLWPKDNFGMRTIPLPKHEQENEP